MTTIEIIDPIIEKQLVLCKNDINQLEPLLGEYVSMCATCNLQMIEYYSEQIIKICLSWETENPEVIAIRLICQAMANYYYTKFQDAIKISNETLEILNNTTFNDLIGLCHFILGASNRSLGEVDNAVEHLIKGTENISPEGEFVTYYCYCHYQLADINIQIEDFSTAENHYNKVMIFARKIGNSSVLFRTYNGIANLNLSIKNMDKCKEYLDLCFTVKGISDAEESRAYCDLGSYYHEINEYEKAIENLKTSYDLRIKFKLYNAASTSLLNLGKTQLASNDLENALNSLEEALQICLEYKSKSKQLLCHELMADAYEKIGEWKKSVQSFQLYKKLMNELMSKQLKNIYTLKNNQINKQKTIIEEHHQDIRDSILYAKRLQNAILPSFKEVDENFPNNFIFFEPKDQVSGDFYWFEHFNGCNYLAVADCTGHGVPGAMVSIVCSNALNRSVKEFGITEPSKILDKTRELVIETFAKSGEDVKDGMDISLCAFKGNKVIFSGANNPLWLVRKTELLTQNQKKERSTILENEFSLIEYKANKQPIGLYQKMKDFTQEEIYLHEGDNIYFFTDGFADQFGGEKGKKFKYKPFKKLLLKLQPKTMKEQSLLISDTFKNWKGKLEQIDDVCVIGINIE